MAWTARQFTERLDFVLTMHDHLRHTCLAPGTDEGHFVNESTVVRLAAMMEAAGLKPEGEPGCVRKLPPAEQERWRADRFSRMGNAEKTVRTLFLLRHLIVHSAAGRFLPKGNSTSYERAAYDWFCCSHPDARVAEGETLRLPFDKVITPLADGCRAYAGECLAAEVAPCPAPSTET